MKWMILILAMCLYSFNVLSQAKGVIVDKDTNRPINIVAVALQGKAIGTYTNEFGGFSLSEIKKTDSILLKHISYHSKTISYDDLNDTVYLNPRINCLNEVSISPSKYSEEKSKARNKNSNISFAGFPGLEVAQLINMGGNSGYVKSIKIFIRKIQAEDSTSVRLHLYFNNEGKPGDEILLNNGISKVSNRVKDLLFNVESEKVEIPLEGLFVGIEWINQIENDQKQLEPRILISKTKQQKQNTYYRFWDKDWESLNSLLHLERANSVIELKKIVKDLR